ncbi:MAG: hypothetical protein IJB49_02025 [Clostridia bacterium]|nr:hypothetical protein [Clostridia bacterium]
MDISIKNKTITSIAISNTEMAWAIEDANLVLEYLKNENKVVLGGDILNNELEYNYDSWYYNVKDNQNSRFDVEYSIDVAIKYISNYIKDNGNAFFVVFVID